MVRQIQKILYTTDLSKSSIAVFEQTVSLAAQTGAAVSILHVIETGTDSTQKKLIHLVDRDLYEQIRDEKQNQVKNVLIDKQRSVPAIQEALQALCDKTNQKVCKMDTPVAIDRIEVHYGNAADVISLVAKTSGCDLIVMGYNKRGSIFRSLMGHPEKSVMKQATCPVMLVPIEE